MSQHERRNHWERKISRELRTDRDLIIDLFMRVEDLEAEVAELLPLTSIKIQFTRINAMSTSPSGPAPVAGPVTLTAVGQQVVASVLGFDQFGNPFTGTMPAATLSASDTAGTIASFDPVSGTVTAVANGVDNITASLTSAEGLALTDTEAVTVAIPVTPPPTPVLSSVKVAFAPVAAAVAAAVKK
jgi:hypothetical protein